MIERSPFCVTCPTSGQVSAILEPLGFHLVFQMKVDPARAYKALPPLPAQYHYEGPRGASVIYLAGRDLPCFGDGEEDEPAAAQVRSYPEHASRFWIAAPDAHMVRLVLRVLSRFGTLKYQRAARAIEAA